MNAEQIIADAEKPQGNGVEVIKIGRKGARSFAFGDGPPFRIDVVLWQNRWADIDRSFRDDKGEVPRDKLLAYDKALFDFVKQTALHGGVKAEDLGDLTMAEVLEFRKQVIDAVDGLADFFRPKSRPEPSSPASSGVRFSE